MQYNETPKFNQENSVPIIQISDKKPKTIDDFKTLQGLAAENTNFKPNQKDIEIKDDQGERTIGHDNIDVEFLQSEHNRLANEIQAINEVFLNKHPKLLIIKGLNLRDNNGYYLKRFKDQQLIKLINIPKKDLDEYKAAIEPKKQELNNIMTQLQLVGYEGDKFLQNYKIPAQPEEEDFKLDHQKPKKSGVV